MQIPVYCPICSTTTTVEFKFKKEEKPDEAKDTTGIPIPNEVHTSGLEQLSVVHNDHILVLDVDYNGAVRKTSTVTRVGAKMQQIMASCVLTFLQNTKEGKKINFKIFSDNPLWRNFTFFFSGQLMINLSEEPINYNFYSTISNAEIVFQEGVFSYVSAQKALNDVIARRMNAVIVDAGLMENEAFAKSVVSKIHEKGILAVTYLDDELEKKPLNQSVKRTIDLMHITTLFYRVSDIEKATHLVIEMMNRVFSLKEE